MLLMLKDGSQAWEVKDFLVQQDRCEVVTIEGKDYPGKGSAQVSYHEFHYNITLVAALHKFLVFVDVWHLWCC